MAYIPHADIIGDKTIAADGRNLANRNNGEPVFVQLVCGRYYDYATATGPAINCQGFAGTYESVAIALNAGPGKVAGGQIVGFVVSPNCQGVPPLTDAEKFAAGCTSTPPPEPTQDSPLTPPVPPPAPGPIMADCCSTLADILRQIVEILKELKEPVRQDCNSACDTADSCVADIAEKLCKNHGICNKTCGECCDELKLGVTQSAEDAATCSRCACEDVSQECSMAGLQPGEKCPNCGSENCCCSEEYTCEPCDEEPDKPKKYIGWCNKITGVIIVLKEGSPSPGSQYAQASIAETEEIAFAEAERYCQKPDEPPKPTGPLPDFKPGKVSPFCNIGDLLSVGGVGGLLGNIDVQTEGIEYEQFMRAWATQQSAQAGSIPIVGPLIGALLVDSIGPLAGIDKLAPNIRNILGCGSPIFDQVLRGLTAVGLYAKWSGAEIGEFADTLYYVANAACRRKHLDPDKAIAAWLANSINDKSLDSHWAIAGFCPEALDAYKLAAESKPIPMQLIVMRFRGLISESEYHAGMQRLGYKSAKQAENIYEIQRPLPTLADIVSFMVRDADDETPGGPVKRFGLDSNFDDKYGDQLKKWSEQQGIDEKIARYAWRSHWTIPSPTQLFEFYHRLRKKPEFPDLLGDVKAALIQQDILPYWHEHFLAVSFRPMGRVDVRRAFNIGAIDDKRVTQAYSDLGYDDKTADDLTLFSIRLRDDAAVGHKAVKLWLKFAISGQECQKRMIDGGLPINTVVKAMLDAEIGFRTSYAATAFKNGEIPRANFVAGLIVHGVSNLGAEKLADQLAYAMKVVPSVIAYEAGTVDRTDAVTQAVEHGMAFHRAVTFTRYIDAKIDKQGSLACQHGIKQRYLLGEINDKDVIGTLVKNGITQSRAEKLAGWWQCEKKTTGKAVAANTLCEWRARGAIGALDFRDRLVAVGYTADDALNLVIDCEQKLNTRQAKMAKQQLEEQARDVAKANAQAAKAQAAIDREAAKQKRATEAAKATLARRQGQLMKAADKVIKKCACDVGDAVSYVSAAKQRLQAEFGLSVDESLQALLLATDTWDGKSFDSLASLVNYHAQLIVDESLATAEIGPLPSSSTNGST